MANEDLKQLVRDLHLKIVTGVNPDSVMDVLFEKKVISTDDCTRLREAPPTRKDRCRDLLYLLHDSSHPQAFIHLRLALLDDYSWIVDEIDKHLPSLTFHLQQLHLDQPSDGKLLLRTCKSLNKLFIFYNMMLVKTVLVVEILCTSLPLCMVSRPFQK